ncbi:unnamed protein product [Amoebophrya sp. A120]|nr:unnamed protein product [Amoebophrya sp. A120]|eukprot:GSA120T00020733001.1
MLEVQNPCSRWTSSQTRTSTVTTSPVRRYTLLVVLGTTVIAHLINNNSTTCHSTIFAITRSSSAGRQNPPPPQFPPVPAPPELNPRNRPARPNFSSSQDYRAKLNSRSNSNSGGGGGNSENRRRSSRRSSQNNYHVWDDGRHWTENDTDPGGEIKDHGTNGINNASNNGSNGGGTNNNTTNGGAAAAAATGDLHQQKQNHQNGSNNGSSDKDNSNPVSGGNDPPDNNSSTAKEGGSQTGSQPVPLDERTGTRESESAAGTTTQQQPPQRPQSSKLFRFLPNFSRPGSAKVNPALEGVELRVNGTNLQQKGGSSSSTAKGGSRGTSSGVNGRKVIDLTTDDDENGKEVEDVVDLGEDLEEEDEDDPSRLTSRKASSKDKDPKFAFRKAESRMDLDDILRGEEKRKKRDALKMVQRGIREDVEEEMDADRTDGVEDIAELHRGGTLEFSNVTDKLEGERTRSGLDINAIMMRSKRGSQNDLTADSVTALGRSDLAGVMEDKKKVDIVPLQDVDPDAVAARWHFRRFCFHFVTKVKREFAGLDNLAEVSNDELLSQLMFMGDDGGRGEDVGPQYNEVANHSHWTYRRNFNRFLLLVIIASLVIVGLEADFVVRNPDKKTIEHLYMYFLMELVCFFIFCFEAISRFSILGLCYFADFKWATVALMLNALDVYHFIFIGYFGGLKMGYVIRFIRFFQSREMFYYFPLLDRKAKKTFFIRKSSKILSTLGWCMMLILLFVNVMSIFYTSMIKKEHEVMYTAMKTTGYRYRDYWGVSIRSFGSLFQIVVFDKGVFAGIIRPMIERVPFLLYPFFFVYMIGTLGLIQVLAGSIVALAVYGLDTAKKVAYESDLKVRQTEIMALQEPIKERIVHDHEHFYAKSHLLQNYLLTDPQSLEVFEKCKLEMEEVIELVQMLDRLGNGDVSVQEFLGACSRLHGDVHSKDVYTLVLACDRLSNQQDRLALMLSDTFRHLLFVDIVAARIGKVIKLRREAEGFRRFGSVGTKMVPSNPKYRMPPFFVKTYHPPADSIRVRGVYG